MPHPAGECMRSMLSTPACSAPAGGGTAWLGSGSTRVQGLQQQPSVMQQPARAQALHAQVTCVGPYGWGPATLGLTVTVGLGWDASQIAGPKLLFLDSFERFRAIARAWLFLWHMQRW